ncbi:alpha/beta fold hydrolase [Microbacterium sp. NIBRBAC000506063]|uniref:alpha/beta fold hydrolase n=1 Tax=Microbacterium sp. NIBRBAC000506063 TaxID=2734618 RepID=UPI001CB6E69E|nr:alpha/beta fold hydrolase [Microbacterium sp. NIBRBAC000506063]
MAQTAEFTDAHGIVIVYDIHPVENPRGIVQLLHGVGEHAGRYGKLIEALNGAGFTVYADDHRGHGRTGIRQHGTPERLGKLGKGGLTAAKEAVWQLTEIIRAEHPDLPLILLGHSWGSFLAQMLVNDHASAYDALVLSGSALRMPNTLNAAPLNARWKGPEATGNEWLSRDPEVGKAFDDDPLTTSTPLLKLFGPIEAAKLYGLPRRTSPATSPCSPWSAVMTRSAGGERAQALGCLPHAVRAHRCHDPRLSGRPARDLQRAAAGRSARRPAGVAGHALPGRTRSLSEDTSTRCARSARVSATSRNGVTFPIGSPRFVSDA